MKNSKIDALNLSVIDGENVVVIGGDLYVKNYDALVELVDQLRMLGYNVKDLRHDPYYTQQLTAQEMEARGMMLWHASVLNEISAGKCGSCGQIISRYGIRTHGHQCEKCGAVTYLEYEDGTTIRFMFNEDDYPIFGPSLQMKVHHWDQENGLLFLYPQFEEGGYGVLTGNKAEKYLDKNANCWHLENVGNQSLMVIPYAQEESSWQVTSPIEIRDTWGRYINYQEVMVWQGQEYSEHQLPVPTMISIFETWHWAPLSSSPTLHERLFSAVHMVSDPGFYHQDGRRVFDAYHWQEIGKFILHFTDLDAEVYDHAWHRFINSGPGGIRSLAHFCSSAPIINEQPNAINTLNLLTGADRLTAGSARAAIKGMDDQNSGLIMDIIDELSNLE